MDIRNLLDQRSFPFTSDHTQSPKRSPSTQRPQRPRRSPEQLSSPIISPIPCTIDLITGSLEEKNKRKANTEASRRFRNRKREEKQRELHVNAQIESLKYLCAFYESERNYFRDELHRYIPSSQLAPRPPTPQPIAQLEKIDPRGN